MVLSSKNKVKAILVLFLFIAISPFAGAEGSFSKNLRFGDRNDDVLALQKTLNKDPKTRVAQTGPGSLGRETSYFGSLTYGAVVRFQELYKTEVLEPINLTNGTGFVGSLTRKKLNTLFADVDTGPGFFLIRTDPEVITRGHYVNLYGSGFEEGDSIYIGGIESPRTAVGNGGLISFAIPQELKDGNNPVKLERDGEFSNEVFIKIITTTSGSAPTNPEINEIIPSLGSKGTMVTIKGKRFSENNTVYLGYDMIDNVKSSDGETILVTINPPWVKYPEEYSAKMPLWIYVENEGGISGSAIFEYQL